jgi:hypothetical protein
MDQNNKMHAWSFFCSSLLIILIIIASIRLHRYLLYRTSVSQTRRKIQTVLNYESNAATENDLPNAIRPTNASVTEDRNRDVSVYAGTDPLSLSHYLDEHEKCAASLFDLDRICSLKDEYVFTGEYKIGSHAFQYLTLCELSYLLLCKEKGESFVTMSFLATYTSFISVEQLLNMLMTNFVFREEEYTRKRIMDILVYLINGFWSDLNTAHICVLIGFIKYLESKEMIDLCQPIRKALVDRLSVKDEFEGSFLLASFSKKVASMSSSLPDTINKKNSKYSLVKRRNSNSLYPKANDWMDHMFNILHWHPREIARQLTLIDAENFCRIPSSSLVNGRNSKQNLEVCSSNDYLGKMISHFNNLLKYFCNMLLSEKDTVDRVLIICYLIDLADELVGLKNFSSFMAVHGALRHNSIFRLEEMWRLVDPDRLQALELCDEIGDNRHKFKNMKLLLNEVKENEAAIPYIGIYLLDIATLDATNSDTIIISKVSKINFQKRIICSKILAEFQYFQKKAATFKNEIQPVPFLRNVFTALPTIKDKELMKKSLSIQASKKRGSIYDRIVKF